MDLNQNISECIMRANSLFSTTVTNICTGATHIVEHGSFDVALGIALVGILGAAVFLLVTFDAVILRGY